MSIYLGRPGTALTALQSPRPGYDRSPAANEGIHQLLGGGAGVDRSPWPARTWQLNWQWDNTVWWTLLGYYTRQRGPGPFALLDPAQVNYLTANQAAGTDTRRDASGFTVVAGNGETVTSSATVAYADERSLKWSLPAAVTSGVLTLAAPTPLTGWPTPTLGQWTAHGQFRTGASGDTAVDTRLALQWLDTAGAQITETLGTAATLGSGAWTQLSATGTAPAGAVYVVPRVKVTAGSVSAIADVHADALQLQPGTAATTWRPGEGPTLVSFVSLKETLRLAAANGTHARDIVATLAQVAVAA